MEPLPLVVVDVPAAVDDSDFFSGLEVDEEDESSEDFAVDVLLADLASVRLSVR